MIQTLLHLHYCALLDWQQPRDLDEAEEDLRDAVVAETGRLHYESCSTEELEEMATWLVEQEERGGPEEWSPDDLPELEQAFLRRLYDLREPEPAAAE